MTGLPNTKTGFTPGRIQNWIRRVFVILSLSAAPLFATTFTVTLDRESVQLGDAAVLALKFDGGQPQGTPQLPQIPGLQITYSGPSSSFSFVNGQTSSSITHSFSVKPTQTGDFIIPSLSLKFGTETLTSQALALKVIRPAAPEPGSDAEQQQLALLRLVLPRKELFVGETIVLEMQLLIRSGVQGLGGTDLPGLQSPLQIDGCSVGKVAEGARRQITIGTTPFTLVPIQIPVTAIKTGLITVGPLDGAVVVQMPARAGGRDPFDPFGMFNRVEQQRVAVSAPQQTVTVLPLPEQGKPANFTGAVGTFAMTMTAGPTNVAVGDPITIHVKISGHGSLDSFVLPDQSWKEFRAYPATSKTESTGPLGLDGVKSFEQVVVPQNTEVKELPPFAFAVFNPEKRAYETLLQPAIPIVVRPAGSTPTPTLNLAKSDASENNRASDIVHIKQRLGRSGNSTTWVEQKWFVAAQAMPVFALLGALLWRRRADAIANNPRLRRRRQVGQVVESGIVELHALATTGKADDFFAKVVRLIQEQIGERLDMPASGITEAVIDERLRARGLADGGADVLHELFQSCNHARYAPEESAQKLEAVIPKLKMALRDLQEVKG